MCSHASKASLTRFYANLANKNYHNYHYNDKCVKYAQQVFVYVCKYASVKCLANN